MNKPIYHANAFCGPAAEGNPGAVCIVESAQSVEWMQAVAQQMNLSDTGFLQQIEDSEFHLRWFTPTREMPLCGHVTLCAAHIVWNEAQLTRSPTVTFHTASGPLRVRHLSAEIEIDLPASTCVETLPPAWLRQAIPVEIVRFLASEQNYLIEFAHADDVEHLAPNFDIVRRNCDRGIIVTARSDHPSHDIVSRYFASYAGVDEDPATGAAHCYLVPYWSQKLGQNTIRARQASRRGGELRGRVQAGRVILGGKVKTVLSGELRL